MDIERQWNRRIVPPQQSRNGAGMCVPPPESVPERKTVGSKRRRGRQGAAIFTAVCLTGCGPHRGTKMRTTLEESENLVYLDWALTSAIPCRQLTTERLPSGRLRVLAQFYNKRNRTAECAVQLKFKDDAQRVLDETGWMPLLLPRRELTQFEHTSLTTQATDFVLLLRAAGKNRKKKG